MREQHSQGYFFAAGVSIGVAEKLRKNCRDGSIEIEQAALIKQHCHGSGRDDFGKGTEIEKSGWTNFDFSTGRLIISIPVVREMPRRFQGDEPPTMSHRDGSAWKSSLDSRFFQNGKCIREPRILTLECVVETEQGILRATIQDRYILEAIVKV